MYRSLNFNILKSEGFDAQSLPIFERRLEERGHTPILFASEDKPSAEELLDCDVFVDRSAVVDVDFFRALATAYQTKRAADIKPLPVMVDNPFATMVASDKRKTHELFPSLVPESHNLDGVANIEKISRFANEDFVVIKDPFGWYSKGTEKVTPEEALDKHHDSTDLIVQKYVPFNEGVGRAYTLHHNGRFDFICNYLETPNMWRTGVGAESTYQTYEITDKIYRFIRHISKTCGLYLNAIDYIEYKGKLFLLETNSVPNLYAAEKNGKAPAFDLFISHMEDSAS